MMLMLDTDDQYRALPPAIRNLALLAELNERYPGRLDKMAEMNLASAMAQAARHGR